MTRYIAIKHRPKSWDGWEDQPPIVQATTIYEADDKPEETGLVDANGTPLYRVKERAKLGYV